MTEKQPSLYRINLKPGNCKDRKKLIQFCLKDDFEKQYVVIGWSSIYKDDNNSQFTDYNGFYDAVLKKRGKSHHALNVFRNVVPNDLFWTRDLNGYYWICRAKEGAAPYNQENDLDIGAMVPVEAYKVGLEVPGQIKASFTAVRNTIHDLTGNELVLNYSKYEFNKRSGKDVYSYDCKQGEGSFLDNLPDFDLEELVISYIQLKENYYVLSNSIANHSTTIKIECEFISRDPAKKGQRAVVQVKGGRDRKLKAEDFKEFTEKGCLVYLYAPHIENTEKDERIIVITKEELERFYQEYKGLLPDSITQWENLFQ
ncbi:hypothetical protein [Acidaminococcus fermentans]|mgnify:FL=1|uniref:hypothetical protein n=1 Tax=Acidaminococcus fermentans TaxID=905 RepID=UPI00242DFAD7|nr:hypothetical protein [Acidaminococcus fermentans]